MDKLARASRVLLPTSLPMWLHYAVRVLLGLLSVPFLLVAVPVVWVTVKGGKWLHGRGEAVVRAWEIMSRP